MKMKRTAYTKEAVRNTGQRITRGLGSLICVTALAIPALAQDYDLVINNGRVIDPETMFDDIANVGVTQGRIVAISKQPLSYRAIRLGSYALIIVIGAVMLRSAIQALRQSRKTGQSHAGHDHHHEHHDCLACAALENKKKGPSTWFALAAGVVPCTGALLVLLFGVANDLLFPAILMVAAISTGMAIAMSGIGVLAILGRRMAFRQIQDDEAKRTLFTSGLRIAGAALVLLIGTFPFGLTYSHSGQISLPVVSSKLGETLPQATN